MWSGAACNKPTCRIAAQRHSPPLVQCALCRNKRSALQCRPAAKIPTCRIGGKYTLQFEEAQFAIWEIYKNYALQCTAAALRPKPNLQNLRRCCLRCASCLRRSRGLWQSRIQVIGGGDYTPQSGPQTHHHSVTLVKIQWRSKKM